MLDNRFKTKDLLCVLQDANAGTFATGHTGLAVPVGAAAGTAATIGLIGTVLTAIFDTGGGFTEGKLVIDIDATGNQVAGGEVLNYPDSQLASFTLQGSTTIGFATHANLDIMFWGLPPGIRHISGTPSGLAVTHFAPLLIPANFATSDLYASRYIRSWNNSYGDKIYRYLRLATVYSGTWATGVSYTAFLAA